MKAKHFEDFGGRLPLLISKIQVNVSTTPITAMSRRTVYIDENPIDIMELEIRSSIVLKVALIGNGLLIKGSGTIQK